MELIEYLRFIFKYKYWLVSGLIIGLGFGLGYALMQKDSYRASVDLFVQRQPDVTTTQYYAYDGFYAQQTAAAYTDNAIKLLSNDEIVIRAARSANLPTDKATLARLKAKIEAKKDASQLIKLSVTLRDHDEAAAFTTGLAGALRSRTIELNEEGDKKLAVDSVNTQPFVVLVRPWLPLYGLLGAFVGLLLGIMVTGSWHYSQHHNKKS